MSTPFYVSPEQLMKDRADFARKGIGRGRSLVVVQYVDGIVFVSENLSQALHKVSEIYDRIAFAAVGRYNEFENLRIAGVRLADMRGYAYDRRDVTGRALANAYAQTLGTIFSSGGEKPYEVELFVAEVGDAVAGDQIYRLTYDGQVADEHGFAVMGGSAERATAFLKTGYRAGVGLEDSIRLAVEALGQGESETRSIPSANLEVACLDRTRVRQRKFRRIPAGQLSRILGDPAPAADEAGTPGEATPGEGAPDDATPDEGAPAGDTPTEATPDKGSLADDAPTEGTPVETGPVGITPVETNPVETETEPGPGNDAPPVAPPLS